MKKVKDIVLDALTRFWVILKTKVVLKTDVVNTLTSTSINDPLSAAQGKSLNDKISELNGNLGKKQDTSTAITTGNIGRQSVNYATTAGTANAVAWGNVSGKPSTYPPSGHNHDDRYYTEAEIGNLLSAKARIVRIGWGKTLTIPNFPHGIVIDNYYNAYIIWVAGNPGSIELNKTLITGDDSLNFSCDRNTGSLSISVKNNANSAITYIGS